MSLRDRTFPRPVVTLWYALKLIAAEISSPTRLPLAKTARAWRHGFLRESYLLRDLDHHDPKSHVSDIQRFLRTPLINGNARLFLVDKFYFALLMSRFPGQTPSTLGVVREGRLLPLQPCAGMMPSAIVREWLDERGVVVLKPARNDGGKGIHMLRMKDGRVVSGVRTEETVDIDQLIATFGYGVVTAFVEQAAYAANIFPAATNTLRVLTMIDPDDGRAFIAAATHRFGTARSAPLDNLSRGGVICPIDVAEGTLGKIRMRLPENDEIAWTPSHPDSGAQVEGIAIPNWKDVTREIVRIATAVPFLPYVGWDFVVTDDGLQVIEGNNYSGMNVFPLPMLDDPRVVRFFEHHGVL